MSKKREVYRCEEWPCARLARIDRFGRVLCAEHRSHRSTATIDSSQSSETSTTESR